MPATMDSHERTVRGLQAACLSLLPGLGHLYIGERKAYKVLAASLVAAIVACSWWLPAGVAYAGLIVWSAMDAYRIVKRGRGAMHTQLPVSTPSHS